MKLLQWMILSPLLFTASICFAQGDVADVRSDKRTVGNDERKSYFLIPPAADEPPPTGFGLLVVLPGGDGSEAFHPFVKRIRKHAVPDDFAVAQPLAFKWSPEQRTVWPTEKLKVKKQGFSTEEFVEAVVKDAAAIRKTDPKRVYCMGWSSSGPAIYALALRDKPIVSGSYVAMSVYKPRQLPPLANAKGRSIYIEHSPEDRVCPYWMARKAHEELRREGARTKLVTYDGGHGWRGDVYGRIKNALNWLSDQPSAQVRLRRLDQGVVGHSAVGNHGPSAAINFFGQPPGETFVVAVVVKDLPASVTPGDDLIQKQSGSDHNADVPHLTRRMAR